MVSVGGYSVMDVEMGEDKWSPNGSGFLFQFRLELDDSGLSDKG